MSDIQGFGYILALFLFGALVVVGKFQALFAVLISLAFLFIFSCAFRTISPEEFRRKYPLPDKPTRE